MTISFRMARNVGIITFVIVILGVCLFSYYNLSRTASFLEEIIHKDSPLLVKIDAVSDLLMDANISFERYIQRERIKIQDVFSPLESIIQNPISFDETADEADEKEAYLAFREKIKEFKNLVMAYVEEERNSFCGEDTIQIRGLIPGHIREVKQALDVLSKKMILSRGNQSPLSLKLDTIKRLFLDAEYSLSRYLERKDATVEDCLISLNWVLKESNGFGFDRERDKKLLNTFINRVTRFRNAIVSYVREEQDVPGSATVIGLRALAKEEKVMANYTLLQLKQEIRNKIGTAQALIIHQAQHIQTMMGIVAIGTVLFAAIVAVLMAYAVNNPLRRLFLGTQRVAQGDLSFEIPVEGDDSIGRLAKSFNFMTAQLKETTVSRDSLYKEVVERKAAEMVMRKAKDEAERANQAKNQLLSNVSHELRTPITSVIGYAYLIQKSKNVDEKQKENAVIIRKNAEALLSIVDDILDIANLESEKTSLDYIAFDIATLLENVFSWVRERANKKNIFLTHDVSPSVSRIFLGDSKRLEQILLKLLDNAIKFTETGEIFVKVTIQDSLESENKKDVRFDVIDTGIGIPKEKQQDIFEAFTQADGSETREHGGLGLGLPIAKSLVSSLGGEIDFVSEEGKGSCFSVTLTLEETTKI